MSHSLEFDLLAMEEVAVDDVDVIVDDGEDPDVPRRGREEAT